MRTAFLGRLGGLWGRLGRKKVANMIPSRLQKRRQNLLLGPLAASRGRLGLDFLSKWSKIEVFHLGWPFLMDFSSILAPNFLDGKPTKR